MNKKAIVVFGATGSLAKEKIFPSIKSLLDKNDERFSDLEVIGYGRRDFDGEDFENFKYIKGELDDLSPLENYINSEDIESVYCYVSLPPNLYGSIIDSIKKYLGKVVVRIALEKPFGDSHSHAKKLVDILEHFGSNKFYLTDHYLAKEDVINFSKISKNLRDISRVKNVEISIFQTGDIGSRGAFYDEVGAMKDTGQNHLLNVLAKLFSENSKLDFLNKLEYESRSLVLGQYNGYVGSVGVKQNSKTETYFKADLKYKDAEITLRSGKGLNENRVFINIDYKDGETLYIQVRSKEAKTPHEHIIEDFVAGTSHFSITTEEALAAWKLTERMLSDRSNTKLKIYSKGSSFSDIEG